MKFAKDHPFWTGLLVGFVMFLVIAALHITNHRVMAQWVSCIYAGVIFMAWWHSPNPLDYKPKNFDSHRGVWVSTATNDEMWQHDVSLGIVFSVIPGISILFLYQRFF
jgi:hypothetical protein